MSSDIKDKPATPVKPAASLFQDQPLELVHVNQHPDKPWTASVVPETLRVLSQFPQGCSIICAVGIARKGKSTFLNHILKRFDVPVSKQCAFVAKEQCDHVTSGIWIWGRPLQRKDSDGKIRTFMLMDTQGTNLGNQSLNLQLTAISTMLSSVVVFCTQQSLNNNVLSELSFLPYLANRAIMSKGGADGKQAPGDQEKSLQSMLGTLMIRSRDTSKKFVTNELKTIATPGPGAPADITNLADPKVEELLDKWLDLFLRKDDDKQQLELKSTIVQSFPARHYGITYMPTDDGALEDLDKKVVIPEGSSYADAQDKAFANSLWTFVDRCIRLAQPKRWDGVLVNFAAISKFLEMFMDFIATGTFKVRELLTVVYIEQGQRLAEDSLNWCEQEAVRRKTLEKLTDGTISTQVQLETELKTLETATLDHLEGELKTAGLTHEEGVKHAKNVLTQDLRLKAMKLRAQFNDAHQQRLETSVKELKMKEEALTKQGDEMKEQLEATKKTLAEKDEDIKAVKVAVKKGEDDLAAARTAAQQAKDAAAEANARAQAAAKKGGICVIL